MSILTIRTSSDIGAKLRFDKPAIDIPPLPAEHGRRPERLADRERPSRLLMPSNIAEIPVFIVYGGPGNQHKEIIGRAPSIS
jgi:hypothetical protein